MTTELSDYNKFAEGPLQFPFNGKTYTVPDVSIPEGIRLAGLIDGSDKDAKKMKGADLWQLLLGKAWDEMVADGVPLDFATRAGLTVLADRQYGRDTAVLTWETGADPKAIQPYLELQAAKNGNRAQRRSSSTGGAKKTQPRASTKVTSSRPVSEGTSKVPQSVGATF